MIKQNNTKEETNLNNQVDPILNFNENFDSIAETYKVNEDKSLEETPIKNKVIQITQRYANIENIPFEFALIGICALLQSGAYLKSVTNRRITINNKEFTKKNLLFAAEQADNKYTLRAIARSLKITIAKVSNTYNIPGHLFARFKVENANLIAQSSELTVKKFATYCTDFQIENPDTPSEVREFLSNREKTRKTK